MPPVPVILAILNINLIYGLGLIIDRDLSFLQTLHAIFATLTLWGTYIFCRITSGRFLFAILSVFVLSQTYIIHFARFAAYVDLASMYFMFCCFLSLYLWSQSRSFWLLTTSAIAYGIALGTKYLMFAFALPIALTIIVSSGIRSSLRPMLIFASWSALFGLWWYIRNYVFTGNPVHPFGTSVFGLHLWDSSDVASQANSVSTERIPRTVIGILTAPFIASKDFVLIQQGPVVFLWLLYISTIFSGLLNKTHNCILVTCWIYTISWIFGTQDPRHFDPVMPLILIYSCILLNRIFSEFQSISSGKFFFGTLSIAFAVYLASFVQQQFVKIYFSGIGDSAINESNMRTAPSYDLIANANEIFGEKSTVYEFFMRDVRWFFKGNLVGNQFGPHGYIHIANSASSADNPLMSPMKLESVLRERYHAQGFIIPNPDYMNNYNQEEFDRYFLMKYRNAMGTIYQFKEKQ